MRKLAQLAEEGVDPTHGGQAAQRRGRTIANRKKAIREWERQFGKVVDLTLFDREILPLICEVPLKPVRRGHRAFTALRLADQAWGESAAPAALDFLDRKRERYDLRTNATAAFGVIEALARVTGPRSSVQVIWSQFSGLG